MYIVTVILLADLVNFFHTFTQWTYDLIGLALIWLTKKKSKNRVKGLTLKSHKKDDIKTNLLRRMLQFVFQNFPTTWNKQTSRQHIKISKLSKKNFRPISILPNISRFYKRFWFDHILRIFFRNINVVLVKVIVHNIVH